MLSLYGILISSKTSDASDRVQRKAAHWIPKKHELHLEYLAEHRPISRLTFLYKILNEHVAVSINYLTLLETRVIFLHFCC